MPISFQAALLGIVQGVTEFLPVSSSAHLILARAFFGLDTERFGLTFDVAVHAGTLVAVVAYFRSEMVNLVGAVIRMVRGGLRGSAMTEPDVRLVWLLVVGSIPIGIVGALFGDVIEYRLRSPHVTVVTLTAGAIGFLVAERVSSKRRGDESLTLTEAWWIGCAQTLALVPGVSRSGATITAAMLFGLTRPEAARFVFLLGVPAILGAAAVKGLDLPTQVFGAETLVLFAVGVGVSGVVGYLAIRFFIRYLANHSLDVFAWYRIALAAAVVVWLWRGV